MVANEVLKDKNLSFKAKGMYAYLFSKPDEWDFSSNRMTLETKDGRKSIMAMLRELEENGYLQREKLPSGKMEYTLKYGIKSLSPESDLRIEKPKSPFGTVPKRLSAESSPISNTEDTNNKEKKVIHNSGVPPQDIQSFIKSFEGVNPSYEVLFRNTAERAASERLIIKFGLEKMLKTTEQLQGITSQPYAPRITTPYELERNLGKLIIFVNQQKVIISKKETKII